jgi:hypothetical protein
MSDASDKEPKTPKPRRRKRARAGAKPKTDDSLPLSEAKGRTTGDTDDTDDLDEILDPDSVVSESTFTSPKGNKYRVITTDEMDPYDKPEKPPKKKRE